jgi:hypothetical protein
MQPCPLVGRPRATGLFRGARSVRQRTHVNPRAAPRTCGSNLDPLVPRHSDYDWLILSQSRMGKSSGGTRIWMLLATPG